MAQHNGRLGRGEDLRARAFEKVERRACGVCGDLEGPAQVLARMTQTDLPAVMIEDVVIKRGQEFALAREARLGLAPASGEKARERAGKPRPAPGAAAAPHRLC